MGFFTKKKETKNELPPLKFPEFPKYKSVMKNLDHIKDKLEELEKVVNKLDDIKKEEDEELSKWHSDLEHLKERLGNIDKTLFEN
jgi:peptidoglycan hydrolase CwlO-like protein